MTRELDYRTADGLEVSLLWDPESNGLTVFVLDTTNGVEFEIDVPGSEAMESFHHPFAYAASGRVSRTASELRSMSTG